MYSINLTIHNKGFLVKEVLERIKQYTTNAYELVIVLDGCSDDSESIVQDFVKSNTQIKTKILQAPNVFETKANNLAAKSSDGDYIIIIQDDMLVNELGWNKRLTHPIREIQDTFAVTARTAHNWEYNPNSNNLHDEYIPGQWSDLLVHTDHAHRQNTSRDVFAIRECVNRGPLALDHKVMEALNYFDEIFEPQDMDDHDLCYRAKALGKICGCYWIDYISEDLWGGTRLNGQTAEWMLRSNQKNTRLVYERHKDLILSSKVNRAVTLKL